MKILSTPQPTPMNPSRNASAPVVATTLEYPVATEPKDDWNPVQALSKGLLAFMGRRIPTMTPEFPQAKAKSLMEKIQPGDVIMSTDMAFPGWARMEYFAIGSHYIHAAFVGSDRKVYEAVGSGVLQTDLEDSFKGRIKVAISRPGLSEQDTAIATEFCRAQVGKPYDGAFNTEDNKEFYCSELVSKALASVKTPIATPHGSIFGKSAVAPDAFFKIPGSVTVHDDGSHYWKNKVDYWPIGAATTGFGIAGGVLGGIAGAALGAAAGFVGSILVGNKVQVGHFSPILADAREGKAKQTAEAERPFLQA